MARRADATQLSSLSNLGLGGASLLCRGACREFYMLFAEKGCWQSGDQRRLLIVPAERDGVAADVFQAEPRPLSPFENRQVSVWSQESQPHEVALMGRRRRLMHDAVLVQVSLERHLGKGAL